MKSKHHIKNLVRELDMDIDPRVDERMLDSTLERFKESIQNLPAATRSMNRRTIMKNPLAKLAIAAMVLVALLLGITMFDSTTNTTWANVLETVTSFETYVFRTRSVETTAPRPDGFEFAHWPPATGEGSGAGIGASTGSCPDPKRSRRRSIVT